MGSVRQETITEGTYNNSESVLQLVDEPDWYAGQIKPAIDRVLAAVLLILLSPLLLICSLVVLVFMGRPVIYRQERIGLGGKTFELFKLRTMIDDRRVHADPDYTGPERRHAHKSPEDPRVSPVGAALRSLRFDELPQLWNVVTGSMSLVGPRPEIPEIVESYEPWQHARHNVKPGITGLWQVEAPPDRLMHECTELDIEYVETVSLKTDVRILLRTPAVILRRHGF